MANPEFPSLASLDTDQVQAAHEFLVERTNEDDPERDTRFGVFSNLVLLPSAQHQVALANMITQVRQASSILAISNNPSLADPELVDAVMSNYLITRRAGSKTTGEVTIVVNKLATVSVGNGAVFDANGRRYLSNAAYIARTSAANVVSASDRPLMSLGGGYYAFTINVTAEAEGSDYLVTKDTVLVPRANIANFVRAYATSDFAVGRSTESNTELVGRVANGLSAKVLSGRAHMYAFLAEQFPGVLTSSIIGFGDAEMNRDHSLLPFSAGGRADWYVRTQRLPQKLGLVKEATLIRKTDEFRGIWQFSLDRDEAPGFYDIYQIKLPETEVTGSFAVTQETRTIDATPILGELQPDITRLAEGTFSRYQATVVQFEDTDTDTTDLTVGDVQNYAVTVRALEKIAEIQSLVGSRAHRNYGGDVLVRAAIPCFVSIAFTLEGQQGAVLPLVSSLKTSLADFVNTLGFNGRLHASSLASIIHQFIGSQRVAVSAIDMVGEILQPNGTLRRIRSTETLVVPEDPANTVTARTVVFYLDPEDVIVSAQTVNVPQI